MDTNKPEKTAAPAERDETTDTPVAPLVEIDDPAKLTNKQINDLTGDGLKPEQDGTNKEAAAETMQRNRDAAKGKDVDPAYFAGQGGAVGI